MIETALLTILGVLPLVGGLIAMMTRGRVGKTIAMVFALATLAVGIWVVLTPAEALTINQQWIPAIGAWYSLGADGMAKAMILLTTILAPIVLLSQWQLPDAADQLDVDPQRAISAKWGSGVFAGLVLLVQGLALFVFMSTDVLLFYLFFEATLIPMYFLITGWGGPQRGRAALKFLIFSLLGGLVMLFGVIGVYVISADAGEPSFRIADFAGLEPAGTTGALLFASFFFAFAVKAPMVPVHTWLPDSAEQANPGATAMLVGILDKIGTFGMIRLCLGLFPAASAWATPFVLALAVISVLYGALMAIGSRNLLRLVAYTSVSHFGFMVLGIWAFTTASIGGSIFYMLGHGFSSAAMFLAVDMLVRRRGSADIAAFGGVRKVAPVLAAIFLIGGLATAGLPGTINFVGEFTIMAGAFARQPIFTAVAVIGTVLAAVYVLWAYQRVFTGEPDEQIVADFSDDDADARERLVAGILIALILVFGFFGKPLMDMVTPTAEAAMTQLGMTDPGLGGR